MNGETFSDTLMLELFRSEVETHVESLTAGLLALERDPANTLHIAEMMRGAHSIKGAARIVGIDPAVRIAHVMEDSFIAAQNGKLTLLPTHVDSLLRGVDLLTRIATASKNADIDWTKFDADATPLVAEITAVPAGVSLSADSLPADSAPAFAGNLGDMPVSALIEPKQFKFISEITIPLPVLLDASAAETARKLFIAGLDSGATLIRFDLSMTTDLDATGLAFLAAVPLQARAVETRIDLFGISADLQRVLEVTGVDRLYPPGAH